jgi:O-6-methylguanine DNA methyltransferase
MHMHCYSEVETEIGRFRVACGPKGITAIGLAADKRTDIKAAAGRAYNPVPVDLSGLSEFQLKVLGLLQRVPRGEVRTYAELARKAGRPGAARAVGNTMARNPVPLLVPCHRVVPASGGIGNYGLGKARKRELLRREGAAGLRLDE